MRTEMINRFITYAKVDTQADDSSTICPTSPGQLVLGKILLEELKQIGMSEVTVDRNGYVMATLPSNTSKDVPTIGFVAHLDTATELTGANVNPQIIENFNGKDIILNKELNVVLSKKDFPELAGYKGQTLITTDGTTLLGADNKAGIAEIMTALDYLINHPEIKHGKIRVAFIPDEEIGRGPHRFDVDFFDATYAYTLDGGPLGELIYESFNAAEAKVSFKGRNVHPGTAKDKMINSLKMAMEFQSKFPATEAPEHTDGYDGFYHFLVMEGKVEESKLRYIIRDFDKDGFEQRKLFFNNAIIEMQEKYGTDRVVLEMNDQYYNMKEKIEPVMEIVDIAYQAMKNLGIEPSIVPIRGGTDGSQLSYMGLPTPNIFTGGENYHGKYEYISVESMEKATMMVVEIVKLFEEKAE